MYCFIVNRIQLFNFRATFKLDFVLSILLVLEEGKIQIP
ncbi:hypothetical protein SPAR140_0977 [Streptococcus pneumoniae EU-NP05]|nr:hypothetical protein SPAR140_0977 [Streptococcus pneumoniae EU-NP05]EJG44470.1 hypothetical protein AMCSP13_001267 [Streptococcus pneumoniae 2070335]